MSDGVAVAIPCAACGAEGSVKKYRHVVIGGLLFECIPPCCDSCWINGAKELVDAVQAGMKPNTPADAPRFWTFGGKLV